MLFWFASNYEELLGLSSLESCMSKLPLWLELWGNLAVYEVGSSVLREFPSMKNYFSFSRGDYRGRVCFLCHDLTR